jgi:hypothetical protein
LKEVIAGRNIVLGDTEDGKTWALKALHPADPLTEVRGVPDQSAVPSVQQNYQWTFSITSPVEAPYSVDAFFVPHPVLCGMVIITDALGVKTTTPIINTNVGGSGIPRGEIEWRMRVLNFAANVEKFRVAYMGVTCHHDATALNNSGMLACAQYPIMFQKPTLATNVIESQAKGKAPAPNIVQPVVIRQCYNCLDTYKSWEHLQTMPNAYLGEAKFGGYAPYKLSHTHQKWRNARELMPWFDSTNYPFGNVDSDYQFPLLEVKTFATTTTGFPFGVKPFAWDDPTSSGGRYYPSILPQLADNGMIHYAMKNIAANAGFTFMIRMGFESQVSPGSSLVPFAKLSPSYDPLAVAGYFKIARELKDAYPEEYNDWGKILGVIASAAADAFGSLVPGGTAIVNALRPVVSSLFSSGKKKPLDPPEATKERTQKVLDTVSNVSSLRRGRPGLLAEVKQGQATRAKRRRNRKQRVVVVNSPGRK